MNTTHEETSESGAPCPTATAQVASLQAFLRHVLLGKDEQIDMVIACLLARGHLLLDDLPGTGKTTLAKAIAGAIQGQLARVQCTPDLMPADITVSCL